MFIVYKTWGWIGDMNYDDININVAYFTLFKKVNGNRTGIYLHICLYI